jgi:hypothetical protein
MADYRQFLALSRDEDARREIEQRLSQWYEGKQDDLSSRRVIPSDTQQTNQAPPPPGEPDRDLDLYDLISALGERGLHSIWFGSGLECYGERAEDLYAFANQERPIEGRDLLDIASGIQQTIQGDFHAFDPGGTSHWLFLRAWDGSGFYIEIDDPVSKQRLKTQFPSAEEVEGASPPYEGLFIHI